MFFVFIRRFVPTLSHLFWETHQNASETIGCSHSNSWFDRKPRAKFFCFLRLSILANICIYMLLKKIPNINCLGERKSSSNLHSDLIERVKFFAYRVAIDVHVTMQFCQLSLPSQTIRPEIPRKTAVVSLQSTLAGSIKIGLSRRISNILVVIISPTRISLVSGNVFSTLPPQRVFRESRTSNNCT